MLLFFDRLSPTIWRVSLVTHGSATGTWWFDLSHEQPEYQVDSSLDDGLVSRSFHIDHKLPCGSWRSLMVSCFKWQPQPWHPFCIVTIPVITWLSQWQNSNSACQATLYVCLFLTIIKDMVKDAILISKYLKQDGQNETVDCGGPKIKRQKGEENIQYRKGLSYRLT